MKKQFINFQSRWEKSPHNPRVQSHPCTATAGTSTSSLAKSASLLAALIVLILSACSLFRGKSPTDTAPTAPDPLKVVKLEVFLEGLQKPLLLLAAPGDTSGRLFVVEQDGKVQIIQDKKVIGTFLDVSGKVSRGHSEQGLLGMAFHPDYATNGRFYINFTDTSGDTRVVERKASQDPNKADPTYEKELLFIDQPYANHNGGNVVFGPDKKLYIGTGDGGSANDPQGNGQNKTALLGKMLLLDPDAPTPTPEILMIGLRNPWRYHFDRKTGDLYIADVGQNKYEEITVIPAKDINKKQNLGWNIMEGLHCFDTEDCDQKGDLTPATFEYSHQVGCSITGGFVYRGKAIPELDGVYFYADYCTGVLRSFRWKNGAVSDHWDWKPIVDPDSTLATLSSFGEDNDGELYLLSLDGVIYKFVRSQ
jgi:glucose/arabinose dehydrogenase